MGGVGSEEVLVVVVGVGAAVGTPGTPTQTKVSACSCAHAVDLESAGTIELSSKSLTCANGRIPLVTDPSRLINLYQCPAGT